MAVGPCALGVHGSFAAHLDGDGRRSVQPFIAAINMKIRLPPFAHQVKRIARRHANRLIPRRMINLVFAHELQLPIRIAPVKPQDLPAGNATPK